MLLRRRVSRFWDWLWMALAAYGLSGGAALAEVPRPDRVGVQVVGVGEGMGEMAVTIRKRVAAVLEGAGAWQTLAYEEPRR